MERIEIYKNKNKSYYFTPVLCCITIQIICFLLVYIIFKKFYFYDSTAFITFNIKNSIYFHVTIFLFFFSLFLHEKKYK